MGLVALLGSQALRVLDVRCRSPRSGASAERGGERTHLALLRRGAFAYHLGSRAFVGDPCTALLHREPWSYRVSHPGSAGDDVTVFELSPEVADELFGTSTRVTWPVAPGVQVHHQRLHAALAFGPADPLGGEEHALELLAALVRARPAAPRALRRRERAVVETVKARLSANLERNLPLAALAAEAHASPFHLMRVFRAATGLSLRAYRRQLRVLTALAALRGKERDLAGLAAQLGFSHHSHLTDSFRRVLGVAPSRLRPAADVETRTFVEARPGTRR